MLNSSALNRSAINATAATVALFASASFIAEATVTANATRQKAATAQLTGTAQTAFAPTVTIQGAWGVNSSAVAVFLANKNLGARSNWTATSTFAGFTERVVWAEAGFDASSSFEILADVTLADAAWTASSQFTLTGQRQGSLKGYWETSSGFSGESSRTRLTQANWQPGSTLWAEPTVTVDGITYHEGYTFLRGEAAWNNVPHLTATFIHGALHQAGAGWEGNATLIARGKGNWVGNSTFDIPPRKIQQAQWHVVNSATFTADPDYTGGAGAYFEGRAYWTAKARVHHTAKQNLSVSSTFISQATHSGRLKAAFASSATFTLNGLRMAGTTVEMSGSATFAADGQRVRLATANWEGLGGSNLDGGAVLTATPAPFKRTYGVTGGNRVFVLAGTTNNFSG